MANIKNRSEIIFIYDIRDANPNGDVDENRPRIDEETGINIVTDVRLKRTIRDYLHDFKNQDVFVREEREQDGSLKTKEKLYDEYKTPEEIIKKCIDIRLFGGTFALKKDKKTKKDTESQDTSERAFSLTGPVQFKFGRSLHKVGEPTLIKGTTVLPSAEKKGAGTFWEAYILPYSLICFYGIINENAAKNTGLTEGDIELLIDGMWNGTKNLITRSKSGQMPRLLLQIIYKESNYHIGDLDKKIALISEKPHEEIRTISEVKLDFTELAKVLGKNKDKILKVRYLQDDDLQIVKENISVNIKSLVNNVEFQEIKLPKV
ncbi:MAG TPA: type I-B CRISPR-associated protein Cas7/Csh2 [bacterium]|nr:type I-B CRISPR-associated protein Cas7/Csh2 [bacterium]